MDSTPASPPTSPAQDDAVVPATNSSRSALIDQGVHFLTHPKIQHTPLSAKIAFLQNKGLSEDEIQQAMTLSKGKTSAGGIPIWQQLVGLSATGLILHSMWKFLWPASLDPVGIEDKHAVAVEGILNTQTRHLENIVQLVQVQQAQHLEQAKASQLQQQKLMHVIMELKQDLVEILKTTSKSPSVETLAATSTEKKQTLEQAQAQERFQTMFTSFRALVEQNDPLKIQEALSMLLMYLKNVLEHPSQPRYRRISIRNNHFQQRLACLTGVDSFFSTIGFIKHQDVSFEWTWWYDSRESTTTPANASDESQVLNQRYQWNREILQSLVSGLEWYHSAGVKKGDSSPSSRTKAEKETEEKAVLDEMCDKMKLHFETQGTVTMTNHDESSTMPTSDIMSSATTTAIVVDSQSSSQKNHSLQHLFTTLQQDPSVTTDELVETLAPAYPVSFREITQLVQEGREEDIPGIELIPNEVSSAQVSLVSESSPAKPWAKTLPSSSS